MPDLKKLLNVEDSNLLQESAGVNWVPKNPRELLLPYMSDTPNSEERLGLEQRREKAKKVVDGYTKIIEDCRRLEADIEERCKDVKVPLDRGKHLTVIEAIGRIFGLGQAEEVTFEMYKICIRQLAQIANDTGEPSDDGL